ncbi:MAG: site-2 protease family protein [Acidobacteria bacterium]|nr:site-2 protease family protein [Acidobacteriota bacterium]
MDLQVVLLWLFAWLFSTTVHEAAHAFIALRGGDPTAYVGGQVTLNPIPHIQREPLGMLILPLISLIFMGGMFGWASAPVDPYWAARHPHRAAKMALAGPASNLGLMLLFLAGLKMMATSGMGESELGYVILNFVFIMVRLNLMLFLFNLLPIPPLDGHEGILLAFPEHRAPEIRQKMTQLGNFGIIIALLIMWKILPIAENLVFRVVQ